MVIWKDTALRRRLLATACVIAAGGGSVQSQEVAPNLFSALHWRLIGPFRAGRVTSVAGVAGEPNIYYFGTPGGGVWKTTNGGQVWRPIFDQSPIASIGAIAVAPSGPNVLYVGTGERTAGNGIYTSTDSGISWRHAGLDDARFIQAVIVDPRNPDIAIVGVNSVGYAMLWRPLPKSAFTSTRGIFKTTDGGRSWKKVLTRDETVGVVDLCFDPGDPRTVYSVLYVPASGSGDAAVAATSAIFKSTDEGTTWKPLVTKGLPEKGRGRAGLAIAHGSHGSRLYAVVDQGFYRSDDGGASWQQSTRDPRIVGSEYFSRVFVDPQNPDLLYVAQTSLYRSADGGRTFEAYVGAPSGDDFHVLWIDPKNTRRMLLGVDQGAIVTMDGGESWSSWYNQPTGEFYHVVTDNVFPYHVYGAQQDSGTAAVSSRSDYGEIRSQDWTPIGGFEFCFIAPDPVNHNLVYSGGWYGTVVRFDKLTGQVATVFERGARYRTANMAPLAFAPKDPQTLYFGTQFLLKSTDAARTWKEISPDLTGYVEQDPDAKRNPDQPAPPALTALAPSPLDASIIWIGTSNRVVQLTRDRGASWQDVSPVALSDPTQILMLEASHHDAGAAYVVVGATRESTAPYIARTRDYGRTWHTIVDGIPQVEMVHVVREDPVRKGLLYAGTDRGVFVSFDDGDRWQSLQLNLPVAVVTDLDVHGNDLVASTFGRALWILDDVTPIRDTSLQRASAAVYLFPPATAVRVRWDNWSDTPYPLETPAGENPPDGAIIDFFLKSAPAGEALMTIYDQEGNRVRQFSSQSNVPSLPPPNVPSYWFGPTEAVPKAAGLNRFVWDLRYPPPQSLPYGYFGSLLGYTEYTLPDHAIPGHTPRQQPPGPLVVPGAYHVELSVAGVTVRQPLTITLDPRLSVSSSDLQEQLDLEHRIGRGMAASYRLYDQVAAFRLALADRRKALSAQQKDLLDAISALEKKIDAIVTGTRTAPGLGPVNRDLTRLASSVQSADVRPAESASRAVEEVCRSLELDLAKWQEMNQQDLVQFNANLIAHMLTPLPLIKVDAAGCAPQ